MKLPTLLAGIGAVALFLTGYTIGMQHASRRFRQSVRRLRDALTQDRHGP